MKKTLLFLTLPALLLSLQSCKTSKEQMPPTIPVGALLSTTTGSWSTLGKTTSAALIIAAEDINSYLSKKDAPFRIGVGIADTKRIFLKDLNQPYGMLILGDWFYVANTDGVWRYP
ncbi:MAG: hypothetical protein EOP47_27845, partial [Sphingobacteriaceae bacterium]